MVDLENIHKVHCVGIGGIGVSAVARLFHNENTVVTGSDTNYSPVIEGLQSEGITAHIGHDKEYVTVGTDLVIHTIAVPEDNPELIAARKQDIPVLTYPETLGLLSENFYTVAVSGTHGKTTTTAMLAQILMAADKDPTVIVGSLLAEQHSNFIAGDSDLLVVEACEYRRSFLHLHPDTLIVTNIDTDHLDYFAGLADIQDAFRELAHQVVDDGYIICNPEDPKVAPAVSPAGATVVDFADISLDGELKVPGEHNRENARAACAAAEKLGVELPSATQSVRNFSGTWRRAQEKGRVNGAIVYDDYGHHPTEISSTLAGFSQRFPGRKIVVAFQPHLYSRTKKLLDEFAGSFSDADEVVVLPIYAAREAPDPEVSSELLVSRLKEEGVSVQLAADFSEAAEILEGFADDSTLLVTQGAGDVYQVADKLVTDQKNKKPYGST